MTFEWQRFFMVLSSALYSFSLLFFSHIHAGNKKYNLLPSFPLENYWNLGLPKWEGRIPKSALSWNLNSTLIGTLMNSDNIRLSSVRRYFELNNHLKRTNGMLKSVKFQKYCVRTHFMRAKLYVSENIVYDEPKYFQQKKNIKPSILLFFHQFSLRKQAINFWCEVVVIKNAIFSDKWEIDRCVKFYLIEYQTIEVWIVFHSNRDRIHYQRT